MVIFENHRLETSLDYTEVELDEKENELKEKLSEIERSKLAVIKIVLCAYFRTESQR